ncbi:disease resistance protein (TIR-NBS-LRR class), partial [Thalictrum thalictroides]
MDMKQANDLEFFKGLSDPCPAIFEKTLKQVCEDPFSGSAICISGWQSIGNERILKYVARRALVELKLVDVLIWQVERNKDSSMRNFQLQIADRLGIPKLKEGERDDEDEQSVDKDLSTKIHARLKNCKFLLVHNGGWNLSDLSQMGIPNIIKSSVYSMILVSSSDVLKYHQQVMLDSLSDKEIVDLLHEECLDICDHLAISSPSLHITPDVVMDCILYLLLFDVSIKIETLVQYWFAEGFIGTPTNTNTMDLDAIFKCGQNLLDELQHRHMVVLRDDSILGAKFPEMLPEMLYSGNILLFPRKFKIVERNSNVSTLDLDDIDRISIWDVDLRLPSQSPTNCTKLSTFITTFIRLYDIPEKFFENMENVRVLSLVRSHFTHLPSSIARLGKSLKLLDLQGCFRLECLPLPYLGALGKLEVLDLSGTPLTELPDDSFDGLQSLRLLNLSKCPNIVSLPPSLSCLLNLEHLLLEDCQSLSHLPTSIDQPLQKLQLLHLSGTKLLEIPERFFQGMLKLKILNLSLNPGLISLPISIFNLVKLKKLNLEDCSGLQNMSHCLKHIPSSLEELNLSR